MQTHVEKWHGRTNFHEPNAVVAHSQNRVGVALLNEGEVHDRSTIAEAVMEAIIAVVEHVSRSPEELQIEFFGIADDIQCAAIKVFCKQILPNGYSLTVEKESRDQMRYKVCPAVPGEWHAIVR